MDETPRIYWFKYLGQLNEHLEMADRIELITDAEDGQFIDTVANEGMKQLEPLLLSTEPKARDRLRSALLSREKEKARSYSSIIANQTLVLMCATIDMYLQDAMKTILTIDKNALRALCDQKDISVREVIELADGHACLSQIKDKILKRFDFEGIESKIRDLEKCGIKMNSLFNQEDIDKNIILEAYKVRHSIVHKGVQPFKRSDELQKYYVNFVHFLSYFANRCKKDKKILNDLDELVKAK